MSICEKLEDAYVGYCDFVSKKVDNYLDNNPPVYEKIRDKAHVALDTAIGVTIAGIAYLNNVIRYTDVRGYEKRKRP